MFVAGRAVVDPSNGALSIVPYDGNPDSPRRLISLTQVQVIMARLKVKRAVFILDLSVMPSLGPGSVAARKPSWDGAGTSLNEGRLVQIFSASAIQETLQYDEGRHGLFTYYVLKGLSGEADQAGKGVITAKELCDYVRTEVEQAAKSLYGTEQGNDSPRRLISLTQVQVIMARLKVKRAVFILDLSVMPSLGPGSVAARKPSWDGAGTSLNEGRLVQIFSASAIQETLQYDEGRHGLFTYYVLKGLSGEADQAGKGVITAKELCDYVRTEVEQAAKSLYGTEQVPQCIPPPKAGAKAWASPMARLK